MTIHYRCDCPAEGKCYVKEHMPDWDMLKGCFPPGVRPTDVDGAIELNGYVLFLEWKGTDAPLKNGQERMYLSMTKEAHKQRVLVLFGEKGKPERASLFFKGRRRNFKCDIEFLRSYCKKFAAAAKQQKAAA